jgi:UDP-N-acetylbacillosamine N-acetyltransferase
MDGGGVMGREKVVIWGASGHASYVADIIYTRGEYELSGFLDNVHPERKGAPCCGSTILGGMEVLDDLLAGGVRNIVFGFYNGEARMSLSRVAREKGFNLVTAIHPSATVGWGAEIGAGTVIRAQASIGPRCKLGENVIIGAGATLCHDCVIGDGVYICCASNLAGGVQVGNGTWLGIGSTVIDPSKIGRHTKIGGGSVVTRDIPDDVVAYGSPARVVRAINGNDAL